MNIHRCSEQGSESLDTFYDHFLTGPDPIKAHIARETLATLRLLRAQRPGTTAYLLTSHLGLLFLAEDRAGAESFVRLECMGPGFAIEYRMPEDLAPWPGAWVKGRARTAEEALEYTLIAMERSRGWD